MRSDLKDLISKEEALQRIFAAWTPSRETEILPITEANGRVLAEDQFAGYDLPVVRASQMDGVAVDSARFSDGVPDTSDWKPGVDYVRADTGDDFPNAFDAVIAVENVTFLENGGLRLPEKVNASKGFNVKPRGADVRKGSLVCEKGRLLHAAELAAIAMGGNSTVPVIKKPRVAFLPTGSELVPVDCAPERGQNIDTNSIMVCQMLRDMGAEPVLHAIVKDDRECLREAMEELLPQCDILLVNAGTSKGGEDYCAGLIGSLGESLFHGVAAVPGRPISAAMVNGKPVLNLAGPSFAAFYNMDWAVRPMICRMLGVPVPERVHVQAVLKQPLQMPPFFSLMAAIRLEKAGEGSAAPYVATPLSLRGPNAVGSAAALTADAVYVSALGERAHPAGEVIEVELLRNPAELA